MPTEFLRQKKPLISYVDGIKKKLIYSNQGQLLVWIKKIIKLVTLREIIEGGHKTKSRKIRTSLQKQKYKTAEHCKVSNDFLILSFH